MTDEAKLPKQPKRWLAFLLNLFLLPTGYVYAGAPRWAVGTTIAALLLAITTVPWTIAYPPGAYAIPLLRGDEEAPPFVLLQGAIAALLGLHAAIIARPRKLSGAKASALAIGLYLVLVVALVGWRTLGPYSFYNIPSGSMMPTLQPGDIILAKGARGLCNPPKLTAGATVLSRENGTTFIRRAVAGPGQTVKMAAGQLWIDDVLAKTELAGSTAEGEIVRETLANGATYLTLNLASDSPLDDIAAKKIPPDHWYLLGDNRDNSMDSRVNGPVPADKICAQAVKILYSNDKAAIGRRLD